MIREIKKYWNELENKQIKIVAEKFQIAQPSVKKYLHMSESEIVDMDSPRNYKKRDSSMNNWLNIIFKMMVDNYSNETIYFYIRQQREFTESKEKLEKYIYLIGKNNFPDRIPFNAKYLMESSFPSEVSCFKRTEILKYVLTCNPKVKKDEDLGKYIDVIKEKYPVVIQVENTFREFHGIIMGDNPDKIDEFLEKYKNSEIETFCNGIKRDIAPVKNAISHSVSSGFVEGNNNKFKLLKRIVYGRSGLVNLFVV